MKRGTMQHPKFKRLKRRLAVPTYAVAGVLEGLWAFAAEFAEDGDLSRFVPQDIADHVEWTGDAAELVEALVAERWLDRRGKRLSIHDWEDHLPEYLRERARKRKKRNDLRDDVEESVEVVSADIPGHSADSPVPVLPSLVLPSPTQPNPTEARLAILPAPSALLVPDGTAEAKPARTRKPKAGPSYSESFAAAWKAYPHHGTRSSKVKAWEVWQRRGLDNCADDVLAWVAACAATDDWQRDGGQYVPGMEVWLKRPDFLEPPPVHERRPLDGLSEKGRRTAQAAQRLIARLEAQESEAGDA